MAHDQPNIYICRQIEVRANKLNYFKDKDGVNIKYQDGTLEALELIGSKIHKASVKIDAVMGNLDTKI